MAVEEWIDVFTMNEYTNWCRIAIWPCGRCKCGKNIQYNNMALKLLTMETKETGNFKKYYSLIMIPIMIIFSIAVWISMEKNRSYLINNYPTIEKSTEISGRVTKVNLEKGYFVLIYQMESV
jgi:hypothetical protein